MTKPKQKQGKALHPQNRPGDNREPPANPVSPDLPPSPPQGSDSNGRRDHTPRWKKWLESAAVFIALGILIVNTLQYCANKKAADAAHISAQAAQNQTRALAARLTFENFKVNILPGDDFIVEGKITVRNSGGTVADDIAFTCQSGMVNLEHHPVAEPAKRAVEAYS